MLICDCSWQKREVPDDWKRAINVPLYKDIGSRSGVSVVAIGDKLIECARKSVSLWEDFD